jgi:putative sterol carrier protein
MSAERVYLWEQTQGKSDQEIMELVNILGRPAVFIEIIMNILPLELDLDQARDCVIGFEITAEEKLHTWRVQITSEGEVTAERRDPAGADATIACTLINFIKLITEELGGVKAFMQGKLWVRGNPTFAYSIPRMFPFREKETVS